MHFPDDGGLIEFGNEMIFTGGELRRESKPKQGKDFIIFLIFIGHEKFLTSRGFELLFLVADVLHGDFIVTHFTTTDAAAEPRSRSFGLLILNHLTKVGDQT